mmetsp:Transcript_1547/g.2188  ORF Transcript_1547/g.2188 Transcript_1547/m.2188 type:complete len:285 (-) Transcript_1547:160-1014(-)|eukprot:CAMPEP_0198144342 /NCGR_PEP_ID=MMETSP1443-20131203/14761_1 /TAXON_ID=186043 /ORGANISM="Entomoneis sp., Strain CCMP2396" /LENGTH=284 /DNA_ID=CAMNT_0043807713 /DNA_START=49 /DNA_END=903 /DNA_ORIENTATION=+
MKSLLLSLVAFGLRVNTIALTAEAFSSWSFLTVRHQKQQQQQNRFVADQQQEQRHRSSSSSGVIASSRHDNKACLFASNQRSPSDVTKGDFEYEELKAQMEGMKKAKLSSTEITYEKRQEITNYLRGILQKRMSPISLTEMDAFLPDTTWRLSFSTEYFASSTGLPRDATIFVEFLDQDSAIYSLKFGDKTFGMKSLKAFSQWKCGKRLSATDPTKAGVVTLIYDKITTDLFGFSNVGVGFFGMIQGRSNYIQTVYFDGDVWVEEGNGPAGEQYFNVYVRQEEA